MQSSTWETHPFARRGKEQTCRVLVQWFPWPVIALTPILQPGLCGFHKGDKAGNVATERVAKYFLMLARVPHGFRFSNSRGAAGR